MRWNLPSSSFSPRAAISIFPISFRPSSAPERTSERTNTTGCGSTSGASRTTTRRSPSSSKGSSRLSTTNSSPLRLSPTGEATTSSASTPLPLTWPARSASPALDVVDRRLVGRDRRSVPLDRPPQAVRERHRRLPVEERPCPGDVGVETLDLAPGRADALIRQADRVLDSAVLENQPRDLSDGDLAARGQ